MASEPDRPHYLRPLSELIRETREQLKGGTVHQATVAHDTWCQVWSGRPCNCNPEITLKEVHGHGGN
jgi:hypothetical protein